MGEFTKGSAWAASCQLGGTVSDLSLEQEVTGLIDKPDRSPLHQKNGGGRVLGLGVLVNYIPAYPSQVYMSVGQRLCKVCGYVCICICVCVCVCVCVFTQTRMAEKEEGLPNEERRCCREVDPDSVSLQGSHAHTVLVTPWLPLPPSLQRSQQIRTPAGMGLR